MEFKKVSAEDYAVYKDKLMSCEEPTCENSFLNAVMWQSEYCYEYAFVCNTLVIRISDGKSKYYYLPITDSKSDFYTAVEEVLTAFGDDVIFSASDGKRLEWFKEKYADNYIFSPFPENFEYIYNVTDLAELKGKKYHSKRNHISAFSRSYNWTYRSMTKEDKGTVLKISDEWSKAHGDCLDAEILTERNGIEIAMNNFDELGIVGGIIEVDGNPVSICFGTAVNSNTFDVNIEKALPEYEEAYAVINREFVSRELKNFTFVNREDDLGIEGLRAAKMSYHPMIILKKYQIKKVPQKLV